MPRYPGPSNVAELLVRDPEEESQEADEQLLFAPYSDFLRELWNNRRQLRDMWNDRRVLAIAKAAQALAMKRLQAKPMKQKQAMKKQKRAMQQKQKQAMKKKKKQAKPMKQGKK